MSMKLAAEIILWLCAAALGYTYAGYPLLLLIVSRLWPRAVGRAAFTPAVSVIITAYNEEPVIARRLDNLLELDYPREKLQLVVTSDASSDRTEEIALQYTGVQVISNPRGGKVAAHVVDRQFQTEAFRHMETAAQFGKIVLKI